MNPLNIQSRNIQVLPFRDYQNQTLPLQVQSRSTGLVVHRFHVKKVVNDLNSSCDKYMIQQIHIHNKMQQYLNQRDIQNVSSHQIQIKRSNLKQAQKLLPARCVSTPIDRDQWHYEKQLIQINTNPNYSSLKIKKLATQPTFPRKKLGNNKRFPTTLHSDKEIPKITSNMSQISASTRKLFSDKLKLIDVALKDLKSLNNSDIQLQAFSRTQAIAPKMSQIKTPSAIVQEVIQNMNKKQKTVDVRILRSNQEKKSGKSSIDRQSSLKSQDSNTEISIISSKKEIHLPDDNIENLNFWKRNETRLTCNETVVRQNRRQAQSSYNNVTYFENLELTNWQKLRLLLPIITKIKKGDRFPLGLYERCFQKAIIKRPYEHEGAYLFFIMIKKNQVESIERILVNKRYLANEIDHTLQSPLHMASIKGFILICRLLIEYNAEINCVDAAKKTPLYYALFGKQTEVVKLLLRKRACPWSDDYQDYNIFRENVELWHMLRVTRRLHVLQAMVRDPISTWKYFIREFLQEFELPSTLF